MGYLPGDVAGLFDEVRNRIPGHMFHSISRFSSWVWRKSVLGSDGLQGRQHEFTMYLLMGLAHERLLMGLAHEHLLMGQTHDHRRYIDTPTGYLPKSGWLGIS